MPDLSEYQRAKELLRADEAAETAAAEKRGYDKATATIAALRSVLADREKELLDLKGPCSNAKCGLHYAHSGPCDV
jgi:hypothetical protein